jgi:uncharacterized protein YndB with AHSA1/START domain
MEKITVEVTVNVPSAAAWKFFTEPQHIMNWNNATADWYTPKAESDFKVGGTFSIRMESRASAQGFDFNGVYKEIIPEKVLAYTIDGGREVRVEFHQEAEGVRVVETFDAEDENTPELQRTGWQAILDNFKKYSESQPK